MKSVKRSILEKPLKFIAAACLVTVCCGSLSACVDTPPPPGESQIPPWAYTYTLADKDVALEKVNEIYGGSGKTYLLGNSVQRMPCPEYGNVMTFNMSYEVGKYAKVVLEDAVDEFNEVFAVINPNYKFRINYTPSQADFESKYSIRMTVTDNFSSPTVMGTAQMSTGAELGNFGITLKDTTLDDLRYLMLTFRHEFMHLLGAGDAYKNPQADKTTVMQNYNNTVYRHFSASDVAFIDAYYRNPDNPLKDEEIEDFIENYENRNNHTQRNLLARILDDAVHCGAEELSAELEAKHYSDVNALRLSLSAGVTVDRNFGYADCSFTELEYQAVYKPKDTYYGAFDVSEKTYEHGTNRGTMSFSQTILYSDMGNGILFAMPGGTANMTLFIRIADSAADKYVLALHAEGLKLGNDLKYFLTFSDLRLTLLQACTVNG